MPQGFHVFSATFQEFSGQITNFSEIFQSCHRDFSHEDEYFLSSGNQCLISDLRTLFQTWDRQGEQARSSRVMPGRKLKANHGSLHFSASHFSAFYCLSSLEMLLQEKSPDISSGSRDLNKPTNHQLTIY
jgi:hypothetical protein